MDIISQSLTHPFQGWLADHPVLAWVANHPLWSIALFFVTLLLFWGLLGAIARLIQRFWMWLLQAPLKFLRWIFGSLFKAIPVLKAEEPQEREQRLMAALDRLEALQQEQELLMQEVKTMLKN
jgi:hypothetical protein